MESRSHSSIIERVQFFWMHWLEDSLVTHHWRLQPKQLRCFQCFLSCKECTSEHLSHPKEHRKNRLHEYKYMILLRFGTTFLCSQVICSSISWRSTATANTENPCILWSVSPNHLCKYVHLCLRSRRLFERETVVCPERNPALRLLKRTSLLFHALFVFGVWNRTMWIQSSCFGFSFYFELELTRRHRRKQCVQV